jgi:hypothetical protein
MYGNSEKEEGMHGGKTHKSVRSINKAIRELKQKAKTMKAAKKGGAKRKGNAWTKLVTKTYKKNHRKNSKYTLKDAIRDAKAQYKKKGGFSLEPEEMTNHEEMIEGGKEEDKKEEKMGGKEDEEE